MKINGEVPTGAMIAATPRNSWDLAVDDGEEASALHVTLKFLGKAIEFDKNQRTVIEHLMRRFVAGRTSFDALVTGVERFGEKGDAIALKLDCPEMVVLHEDAHTITPFVDLKWPEYRPHMTMMYDESGKKPVPEELTALVGSMITFDTIFVAFGTDREYIYLDSSDMVLAKWSKNRDYTIPSPLSSAKEISGRHGHRPAGTSIRWPAMYRELRKKGYSKRKAAMISNGKWRQKHGLPPKSRGTAELAKMDNLSADSSSRRLLTHPRGTLSQLIKDEPAMLNSSDFLFAQTEILKAGTRAGAIKGWITRRRNAGISPSQIDTEGRAKYGKDWDKYGAKNNMGRSTRGVAVSPALLQAARQSQGRSGNTRSRRAAAQRRLAQRKVTTRGGSSSGKATRMAAAKVEALTPIIAAGDKAAKANGQDYDRAGELFAENVRAQYNGKVVSSAAGITMFNGMHEVMVFDDIQTPDGSMNDSQFVVGRFSTKTKAESVKAKYTTGTAPKAKKPAAKKKSNEVDIESQPAYKAGMDQMHAKFTGKNADLADDNWSLMSLRHEREMTLAGDPAAQGFDIDAIDAKMALVRAKYAEGIGRSETMPSVMSSPVTPKAPKARNAGSMRSNDLPKKAPGVNKAVASANARLKAKGLPHRITRNDIDRVARDSVYDEGTTQAELTADGMTPDIVQRDVDEARKNIIHHLTSGRTGPFKDFMDELVDSGDLLSAMDFMTAASRGRGYTIA